MLRNISYAVVLVLVALSVYKVSTESKTFKNPSPTAAEKLPPKEMIIEQSRFIPSLLAVKKGQKVKFTNRDDKQHLLDLELSASDSQRLSFRKKILAKNESIIVTFLSKGTFNFLDRLNPNITTKVVVQ